MSVAPESPRVLLADDQIDVLHALKLLLKAEGFHTKAVDSPSGILESLRSGTWDLLLMDLNYTRDTTSGAEGLDLLERIKALAHPPVIIVMTAWGSIELAVEAMRRGARDFVLKPWDNTKLVTTIRTHLPRPEQAAATAVGAKSAPDTASLGDLQLARQVQAKLFPQRPIPLRTLDYAGLCRQAGLVGGDFYDYLPLDTGRVGLVLADISGKGMAAALLMSNLQAALRSLSWQAAQNLALLLRTINLQFRESTETNRFATVFFGDYDDNARLFRYVNCGHNPPLLLRAGGDLQWLEATAPVVGVLQEFEPEVAEVFLAPGDTLLLYSDGVTEAELPGGEFGEPGLSDWIRQHQSLAPQPIIEELASFLFRQQGDRQSDDITLVCARAR